MSRDRVQNWHEQCVVYWTWARQGRPMPRTWTLDVLDRAAEFSADALMFGVQLNGYVAYHGAVSPPIPDMEGDALALLCDEGHARGLKVIVKFIATIFGCEAEALQHPDWVGVGPDGEYLQTLCYSTPFGDFTESMVREVLEGYPVDGIFFDQFLTACHCRYCRENFLRTYGQEMPPTDSPSVGGIVGSFDVKGDSGATRQQALLRDFGIGSSRHFCRRIRRAIDEIRQDTVYIQNHLSGAAAEACAPHVDAVMGEGYLKPGAVYAVGLKNREVTAYTGKPAFGNMAYPQGGHHGKVRAVEHAHLVLADIASARANPCFIELNVSDYNVNRYDELKEALRQIRWTSDALKGTEPVKYAAILHSLPTEERFPEEFTASFEGFYEILASQQVPLEVVTDNGITNGELNGFKVLVLPNSACLANATIEAIESFVNAGGGLVASYRTGMFEENGQPRPGPALAELLGIDVSKIVAWDREEEFPNRDARLPIQSLDAGRGRPYFRYVRPQAGSPASEAIEGRLLSFHGPYVEVDALEDTETGAHVLDMDQSLMNRQRVNRHGLFPGDARWPLVTLREGSGRVAYVAAWLEPEENRESHGELSRMLRNIVVWAGGMPTVEAVDFPPTVHLSLSQDPDGSRLVVALTNQTTNPIRRWNGEILYVVPLANLELRFRTAGNRVVRVETATGVAPTVKEDNGETVVTVQDLRVAECLAVNFE